MRIFTELVGELGASVEVTWDGMAVSEYEIDDDGYIEPTFTDPSAVVTSTITYPLGEEEVSENKVGQLQPAIYRCEGEQITGYFVNDFDPNAPQEIWNLVSRDASE